MRLRAEASLARPDPEVTMKAFMGAAQSALLLAMVPSASANDEAVARAKDAAQAWLSLADAGEGARTWESSAALFQARVSQDA
jgi:hypothetical protein